MASCWSNRNGSSKKSSNSGTILSTSARQVWSPVPRHSWRWEGTTGHQAGVIWQVLWSDPGEMGHMTCTAWFVLWQRARLQQDPGLEVGKAQTRSSVWSWVRSDGLYPWTLSGHKPSAFSPVSPTLGMGLIARRRGLTAQDKEERRRVQRAHFDAYVKGRGVPRAGEIFALI